MNTDVMFSSKTDLWETPQEFFDALDAEFHFTLDTCALPENAKCARYYTPEQDGCLSPGKGSVDAILHTGGELGDGWRRPPPARRMAQRW